MVFPHCLAKKNRWLGDHMQKIVQNIFFFDNIVFSLCMFIALTSPKHTRKKYNIAEVANIFVQISTYLTEVSSVQYCHHIYQIEALVKIFLLHKVIH